MVGIFDSGVGGLTVVRELLRVAPDASFVYLGDTARVPYGSKAPDVIRRYAVEDAAFLASKGVTTFVVACNTMSALAMDELRAAHPDARFLDVITPAVEDALALSPKHVGVIGTRGTVSSGIYEKLLKEKGGKKLDVVSRTCPLFTALVEEGMLETQITKLVAKGYLSDFRAHPTDALILGCTHYPLLAPVIQHAVGRKTKLVDSATSVVKRLLEEFPEAATGGKQEYYFTDASPRTKEIAEKWLKRTVEIKTAQV